MVRKHNHIQDSIARMMENALKSTHTFKFRHDAGIKREVKRELEYKAAIEENCKW